MRVSNIDIQREITSTLYFTASFALEAIIGTYIL